MILWGLLPLALKALLVKLDSTTIVGFRFLCSALLVWLLLRAQGRLPKLSKLTKSGWWLLLLAILGLGFNYIAYMLGLNLTAPAIAQIIIQLAPPILTIGGLIFFRERFTPLQWFGFLLLLGGLGLFFNAQLELNAHDFSSYYIGSAWVAIAALAWAIYGMAQKQLLVQLSSQAVMLCIYVVCSLVFVPLSSLDSLFQLGSVEWALLAFATLNTVLAYGAFAEALQHLEASRVSAVLSMTPFATILFSRIANHLSPEFFPAEPITTWAYVGATAVVVGSMLVALARRSPAP
ncbi:MAG: drug/metabolite transporter (DMT)-like permease [Planctomycetota bacterium]|jgi:drug/metabolite transporter (DMT)-like permease